jgi:hypothetical protein
MAQRIDARDQNAAGGPLHPRMRTNSSAEAIAVTSSDPAQPRRFEKKTNTD